MSTTDITPVPRDLSSPAYYNYLMLLLRQRMENKEVRHRKRRVTSTHTRESQSPPPSQQLVQQVPSANQDLSFAKVARARPFRPIKPQPQSPSSSKCSYNNICNSDSYSNSRSNSSSPSPIGSDNEIHSNYNKFYDSDDSDEIEIIF